MTSMLKRGNLRTFLNNLHGSAGEEGGTGAPVGVIAGRTTESSGPRFTVPVTSREVESAVNSAKAKKLNNNC